MSRPLFAFAVGVNAWLSEIPRPGVVVDDGSIRGFGNPSQGDSAVVSTATVSIEATGAANTSDSTVVATGTVADATDEVTVVFPAVSVTAADDLGARFQALGGHTLHGAGIPFADDAYWWVTVDGVGVDPQLSDMTGYEVEITGSGPFTGDAVATAAVSAAAGSGYTFNRTGASVAVSGGGLDAAATVTAANSRTGYGSQGDRGIIGSTELDRGSSANANGTAWTQPTNIPAGPFRVVAFGLGRGATVTNGVRMAVASVGTGDGNPLAAVVDHERTMGNSGANEVHVEWLAHDEIPYYSGGERLFIGTHGDGASSRLIAGSDVTEGLHVDGSGHNLWLTDGTTGSTTPFASPVGAVTNSYNYGVQAFLIIEEAPYQEDGAYRVIAGAVPGVHDQDLYAPGSNVDQLFVGWGITTPAITGIRLQDTQIRLQAHASGASNQLRFEIWNALGGASTIVGDTLLSLIGVTSDTQGTGWSSVQSSPIDLSPSTDYRYTIKGEPDPGSESDTVFDLDLGGFTQNDVGHPIYALGGVPLEDTELEVYPGAPSNDSVLDYDPQVATASPNPTNGAIQTPGNVGMIALYLGPDAPTITNTTS